MKNLMYMSMTMQPNLEPAYKIEGFDELFCFPIAVKMAEELKKGEDVTVFIIKMVDKNDPADFENRFKKNMAIFEKEVEKVNSKIQANIKFDVFESDFTETKDVFGQRFMKMFDSLSEKCKIIADITFGTKPTSHLIMSILHFAEKFYDADIDSVIYGKTVMKLGEDKRNHPDPANSKVCDVTILYLFDNLTNVMNANSGEEAKKVFNMFFGI